MHAIPPLPFLLPPIKARTAEQQELIQKDAQHSLANFSLSTSEEQSGSLFDFEGDDYKKKQAAGGLFLNLPQVIHPNSAFWPPPPPCPYWLARAPRIF